MRVLYSASFLVAIAFASVFTWENALARPPLQLAVDSRDGQLSVAWNPAAQVRNALLEIEDGSSRMRIPITGALANICYAPINRSVAVRLVGLKEHFEAHLEIPRALTTPALSLSEIAARFDQTESALQGLRAAMAFEGRKLDALEESAGRLTHGARSHANRPQAPTARFWRD